MQAMRVTLLACWFASTECFLGSSAVLRPQHSSAMRPAVDMKVFDWKVRGQEAPELESITLGGLAVSPGSHHEV